MNSIWPWITLVGLGLYHGINPGMGWLFAVAKGLQEKSRKAVIGAFAPIAIGHAVSIGAVVGLVAALQSVISPQPLRWAGAGILIAFGVYKLVAPMSHPRWARMRVGFWQLTAWSFLMATAHGAGLMVVPVVLELPAAAEAKIQVGSTAHADDNTPACHDIIANAGGQTASKPADSAKSENHSKGGGPVMAAAAVGAHTLAMFLAMAGMAVLVYDRIGLAILRTAWFNLDLLWAAALIGAGALTLVL